MSSPTALELTRQYLERYIASRQLIPFCGAGISRDSGVPMAGQLKTGILQALRMNTAEDVEAVSKAPIPFEQFIELVGGAVDVTAILSIFRGGEVGVCHAFIAEAAAAGIVRTIMTTNFDLLIEAALRKRGVRFRVLIEGRKWSFGFGVELAKVHGCASRPESVRTTLRSINQPSLARRRWSEIQRVFGNPDSRVLVLGYSCSDVFDITPMVQSVPVPRRSKVLFVRQSSASAAPRLRSIDEIVAASHLAVESDPEAGKIAAFLREYDAHVLEADTTGFVLDLAGLLPDSPSLTPATSGTYMAADVQVWADRLFSPLRESHRKNLAGILLRAIGHYDRSLVYFDEGYRQAVQEGHEPGQLACLVNANTASMCLGDHRRVFERARMAIVLAKRLGDDRALADCHTELGGAYYRTSQLELAERSFRQALRLAKKLRDKSLVAGACTHIGNCVKDQKRGIVWHKRAFKIYRSIGDKPGEYTSSNNVGNALSNLDRPQDAVEHFETARTLGTQLGDPEAIARAEAALANCLSDLKRTDEAERCFQKALGIGRAIGSRPIQSLCLVGLAEIKRHSKCHAEALRLYELAASLEHEAGSFMSEAFCWYCMGSIHRQPLRDYGAAVRCYQAAYDIYATIGDREGAAECAKMMGFCGGTAASIEG